MGFFEFIEMTSNGANGILLLMMFMFSVAIFLSSSDVVSRIGLRLWFIVFAISSVVDPALNVLEGKELEAFPTYVEGMLGSRVRMFITVT